MGIKPGQLMHVDDLELIPQPEQISLEAVVLIEPLEISPSPWLEHA